MVHFRRAKGAVALRIDNSLLQEYAGERYRTAREAVCYGVFMLA